MFFNKNKEELKTDTKFRKDTFDQTSSNIFIAQLVFISACGILCFQYTFLLGLTVFLIGVLSTLILFCVMFGTSPFQQIRLSADDFFEGYNQTLIRLKLRNK